MKETATLAAFLSEVSPATLSPSWQRDLKLRLLDWLGCVIGALEKEPCRALLALSAKQAGQGQCLTVGIARPTDPLTAAFCNGVLGHTLECDDVNKIGILHPGAITLPAALAAAEQENARMDTLYAGILAGYEGAIRIGATLNPSHYRHWHATGTCGTFGAAAAAGRVLGLDAEQMTRALALAATMASGLVCVFGTDAKTVTVGNAAQNGLRAAQLAKLGYSAPDDVLERADGYASATSETKDLSFLTKDLGDPSLLTTAGYKLYASCGHTHCALDAVFALCSEHRLDPEHIRSVEVTTYTTSYNLTGTFKNDTEANAKFSLPYVLAAALLWGDVGLPAFTEERRADPALAALAQKITVKPCADWDVDYPRRRPQKVTVTTDDGVYQKRVDLPIAIPQESFLQNKFAALCAPVIGPEQAQQLWDSVLALREDEPVSALRTAIERSVVTWQPA